MHQLSFCHLQFSLFSSILPHRRPAQIISRRTLQVVIITIQRIPQRAQSTLLFFFHHNPVLPKQTFNPLQLMTCIVGLLLPPLPHHHHQPPLRLPDLLHHTLKHLDHLCPHKSAEQILISITVPSPHILHSNPLRSMAPLHSSSLHPCPPMQRCPHRHAQPLQQRRLVLHSEAHRQADHIRLCLRRLSEHKPTGTPSRTPTPHSTLHSHARELRTNTRIPIIISTLHTSTAIACRLWPQRHIEWLPFRSASAHRATAQRPISRRMPRRRSTLRSSKQRKRDTNKGGWNGRGRRGFRPIQEQVHRPHRETQTGCRHSETR